MITEINMPSYIFAEMVGIFTVLVIAVSTFLPGISLKSKRYFIAYFLFTALSGILFAIDIMTYMHQEALLFSKLLNLIEYLICPLPHIVVTLYLIDYCEKSFKNNIIFRVMIFLWVFYSIMLVVGHINNIFFYTAPDGSFYRTPLHPLIFTPIIAILIIDLISFIINRKKFSKSHFYTFLIYLLSAIVSTTIHSFVFAIMVVNIATWICATSMYVLIITDQIEQYMKQQVSIANKNANILILQMRPHFIYNTMTSIYYLCDQNPRKAQQTILDFTTYLRKNFNAIASNSPIPFSEELEHIHAYLSVELAQFEESLIVEYDTKCTDFKLPPLTLEPLIENAIKYGLDPDSHPLQISIKTEKINSNNVIIVKDNGPGFDPENVLNSHNALSNIKLRLDIMCNGSITINSVKGEGTVVKVIIPDK
ncbi:MAG: histidine kinase [Lachnospiraceae bacterium]|nr:histidine kinase [Lachnospiraceae bacterium]